MKTLAIITARAGSKRIPLKNVRAFMGKPMIAYAIEAAQKSGLFEEVMVSTDSAQIADIAKNLGARIPFMRSAKTSDDYATSADVIAEVLECYAQNGRGFDAFCCVYPCVPFLRAETLKDAHAQMVAHKAPAVVPLCKYSFPIERALRFRDGKIVACDKAARQKRSQDLEPAYFDPGMFYFCTTRAFAAECSLLPEGALGYPVPEVQCQDIDTPEDWQMAELKYKMLHCG